MRNLEDDWLRIRSYLNNLREHWYCSSIDVRRKPTRSVISAWGILIHPGIHVGVTMTVNDRYIELHVDARDRTESQVLRMLRQKVQKMFRSYRIDHAFKPWWKHFGDLPQPVTACFESGVLMHYKSDKFLYMREDGSFVKACLKFHRDPKVRTITIDCGKFGQIPHRMYLETFRVYYMDTGNMRMCGYTLPADRVECPF